LSPGGTTDFSCTYFSVAVRDATPTAALQFAEKLSNRHEWEGHEFHSCRKSYLSNSGFQPLREAQPLEETFSANCLAAAGQGAIS